MIERWLIMPLQLLVWALAAFGFAALPWGLLLALSSWCWEPLVYMTLPGAAAIWASSWIWSYLTRR